jgi:hypothetical protein
MPLYRVKTVNGREVIRDNWNDAVYEGRLAGDEIYKWSKGEWFLVVKQLQTIPFEKFLPGGW